MYDLIGLIGVFIVLLAYFLMQTDRLDSKSTLFSILNIVGSVCILISLFVDWNLSAFIIEVSWILISFYALYNKKKSLNI